MVNFKDLSYEEIARYIFIASISFTVFAPAVHYIGFALCLIFLVYGQVRYKHSIFKIDVLGKERGIEVLLLAFFIWSAFPHIPATANFHSWGRGASVYLEMLIWYLLTIRLLGSSVWRWKYISIFVPSTTIIFCMIISVSTFGWFPMFHNLRMNINVLGLYAMMALPYIFYYALWHLEKKVVVKYAVCIICLIAAFISFSSGAWLTIFIMMPLIIYFALIHKKLTMKNIIFCLCLCAVALTAVNCVSKGALLKRFYGEVSQVTALQDLDSLTNHRYSIWRGTIKMILGRPLTGYGRDSFDAEHERLLATDKELAEATQVFDYAHNMYLELAFAGGIPSTILFCVVLIIFLKKCLNNCNMIENGIPWYMIHLTLLVGMVVYGLTGDVFEARRDLAVIFWTSLGIIRVMPKRNPNDSPDKMLCD